MHFLSFPPQQYTLRFNHKFHINDSSGPRLKCATCHKAALTSESARDLLIPKGDVCDNCHMSDHSNLDKVTPGDDAEGKCGFCHVGYKPEHGNLVARFEPPRANMVFNHKKHLDRNIQCAQCHGDVGQLELATRDQLPRMRGCFTCHQMADSAARGTAKSDCLVCHVATEATQNGSRGGNARMRTAFVSGEMHPPRWLHDAEHGPDWIFRHRQIAGNDSQFCANCHREDYCTDCHDGKVRPHSVHPSDYISMHPIEARMATVKCQSCHEEQSFCLQCHQRLGISMSGPTAVRESGRFHPPKEIWSDPPRQPGHHSFEAEKNLNQCVSCHVERDCVVCHGAQGIGGGFNPHRSSFAVGCATQFRRNPRPCFVCHEPGDGVLAQCR
ncbi:MAG: cytochrome c3 family protein [Polyangiaceae bacterium]